MDTSEDSSDPSSLENADKNSKSTEDDKYSTIFKNHNNFTFNNDRKMLIKNIKNRDNFNKKIIVFPSNLKSKDILDKIIEIDINKLSHLFIFDFQDPEDENEILSRLSEKFQTSRPLIVQFSEVSEHKIYYKYCEENTFKLLTDGSSNSSFEENLNLFLKNENFESLVEKILTSNDVLMMRFLYLFKIDEDMKKNLILKSVEKGNPQLLKSALDLKFTNARNQVNPKYVEEILKTAVWKNYLKIIQFLVNELGYIVETFDHAFKQSIVEITRNQEILYQLLTKVDYPFPSSYQDINRMDTDDEIDILIKGRAKFHTAIKERDWKTLEKMIEKDIYCTKITYDLKNQSAIKTALESKQIDVYVYLQSEGFLKGDYENIDDLITEHTQKITEANLKRSITSDEMAILKFTHEKSTLHNLNITRRRKKECFSKIKRFFEDLYKIDEAKIILEIAIKNPDLKIIFDFENLDVGEMCPYATDSSGYIIYTMNQIFISSFGTLNNENNENTEEENEKTFRYERRARSNLIHEISHSVYDSVFENHGKPYYEKNYSKENQFEKILNEYKYLSLSYYDKNDDDIEERDQNPEDDGCDGIISRVYEYSIELRLSELIVRPIEIMAFYQDEKDDHLNYLKTEKYVKLFEFFAESIAELESFDIEEKLKVKKLNGIVGLIQKIKESGIELDNLNAVNVPSETFYNGSLQKSIVDNNYLMIKSNAPFMTLINLFQNLSNQQAKVLESKNLFSTARKMKNDEIFKNFEEIIKNKTSKEAKKDFLKESRIYSSKDEGFEDSGTNLSDKMETDEIQSNNERSSKDESASSGIFFNFNSRINSVNSIVSSLFISEWTDFHNKELEVILDCSSDSLAALKETLHVAKETKFTLIVNNKNYMDVLEVFSNENFGPEIRNVNHKFVDLKETSQARLLENLINFQGNEIQFFQLITLEQAREIVNTELLLLLIEKWEISINNRVSNHCNDNFDVLYSSRNILKKSNRKVSLILDESNYDKLKYNKHFIDVSKIPNNSINQESQMKATEIVTEIDIIPQEKLLQLNSSQKYVLISDGSGNGKSWLLKQIALDMKKSYPYHWVDFVNLNLFIEKFKEIKENVNFREFYVEEILKPSAQLKDFEISIFTQLYTAGKVFLLFDGFDEISPVCPAKVKILIKKFDEENKGNQLWITTRSNFEIELQDELKIEAVYSLEPLTKKECANYIAQLWQITSINQEPFNVHLENAEQLLQDINIIKKSAVGLPQLLKMIAEIYSDYRSDMKRAKMEISLFSCYKLLILKYIDKWIETPLRREQCIRAQDDLLNYSEIHQFYSMQHFFDGESFCDLTADWTEEEIEGAGLAKIISNRIFFNHETFLEFFIASFINRMLRKNTWDIFEDFSNYFVEIFTDSKFVVVRSFLNDCICELFRYIEKKFQLFSNKFLTKTTTEMKVKVLSHTFTENCEENLKFFIKIYDNDSVDNIKEIFESSIPVFHNIKLNLLTFCGFQGYSDIFEIFLNFKSKILTKVDFKDFLIRHETLNSLVKSSYNFEVFEKLLLKIEEIFSEKESRIQILELNSTNIFHPLCSVRHENFFYYIHEAQNQQKVDCRAKKFILICNFLLRNDFEKEKLKNLLKFFNGTTILHNIVALKDCEMLKAFYDKIHEYFNATEKLNYLKIENRFDGNRNFLQISALVDSYEFHETLWSLPISNEDLLTIVTQKDCYQNSYLHILVSFSDEKIVKLVFEKLKEKLNNEMKLRSLLRIKGFRNRNLLQKAVDKQENVKVHEFLWNFIYENCYTLEQFKEILQEVDNQGDTTIHSIVAFSTASILEFACDYLRKLHLTFLDMKRILSLKNERYNRNLLQIAAIINKNIELHKCLWKIIETYFFEVDIISMIEHKDKINCNLFFATVGFNDLEIVKFTWEKIKTYLRTKEKQKEYFEVKGYKEKNLYQNAGKFEVSCWVRDLMSEYEIL